VRIAADSARFGQPEINLGIIPGYAGSQRLPRLVGKGIALEILLSGDMVSAERAYEIGLVNRVVPAAELMAEATKMAHALAAKAPIAARYIIDAVNQGLDSPFTVGEVLETSLFGTVASSEDMKEGTRAFLEKRKADWKGK
jgi:enoyl-CoA hydratase/carnithine racemase